MVGKDGVRILHAFGGLGATAQILDQCAKDLKHTFWERDPVCVEFLEKRYSDVHPIKDSFTWFQTADLEQFDILLMDMSVGTIKTKGVKEMWAKISNWLSGDKTGRFVWFTDTACHKIHLNWTRYNLDFGVGVAAPTAEAYLEAYCRWLEGMYNITVTAAMREAGEIYAVVVPFNGSNRFVEIPYV